MGTHIGFTSYSALALDHQNFKMLVEKLAVDVVRFARSAGAEAIAVRGTSGYAVAFAMRMLTDFPIIVARKSGEATHGDQFSICNEQTCREFVKSYVILDDLVCSGDTVNKLVEDLGEYDDFGENHGAQCLGVLTYYQIIEAMSYDVPNSEIRAYNFVLDKYKTRKLKYGIQSYHYEKP